MRQPCKQHVYLEDGERIVGIHYKKPMEKVWLPLQADFAFLVARKPAPDQQKLK
jgi:hypothetical protein